MSEQTIARTAMAEERLTEDLLERLLASESPEAYLSQGVTVERTVAEYMGQLLERRGGTKADVIRASGLTQTHCYDVFSGKTRPGRDAAVMLAFGLGCDLTETQRLLRLAGVSELWPKVRRDAIVIWCLEHGLSRVECDDQLHRFGEETLLKDRPDVARGRAAEGDRA